MKLIGIIWNCANQKDKEQIKEFIASKCHIIGSYPMNMDKNFEDFLIDLYPDSTVEANKSLFKINTLAKNYDNKNIEVLVLDADASEKEYLPKKEKYMYKLIIDLKLGIRRQFQYLIKEEKNTYGNVFHLSDDSDEYIEELPVIIDYLSKYYDGIFSIDNFVDEKLIVPEERGTRKKCWITNNLLFKENNEGTYEAYNEIFNYYFMKLFGLNNGAWYKIVNYHGKMGVLSKRINDKDEDIVYMHNILKEYGYTSKKDIVNHNTLKEWPFYLPDYCQRHNLLMGSDCLDTLKRLFIYDNLTCQNDRNPTNLCIIYNKEDRVCHVHYFDNANMLFFHEKSQVDAYYSGIMSMEQYLDTKTSSFMLNKPEDLEYCFKSNIYNIDSYLENASDEDIALWNSLLDIYTLENIEKTFKLIEQCEKIMLPDDYKRIIIEYYNIFMKRLNDYLNNNRNKVLVKRS